jgi:hypothetical protein
MNKPLRDLIRELVSVEGVQTQYEEARVDEQWQVRASAGARRIEFTIDPERGWQPTRVVIYRDNRVVAEVRSTLAQFDGRWFPQIEDEYEGGFGEGAVPTKTCITHTADVNRPAHPSALRPADIGIDVGMEMMVFESFGSKPEFRIWDGQAPVDSDAFNARLRRGELRIGEFHRRAIRHAKAQAAAFEEANSDNPRVLASTLSDSRIAEWTVASFQGHWEGYVRRFVKEYALDDE